MKRTTLPVACSILLLLIAAPPAAVTAAPVFNPANGHYYDAILTLTNWPGGRALAEAQCHSGLPGHLVTITSQEENDFIVSTFPQVKGTQTEEYWIGAFQPADSPEPSGNWQWVTGEAFIFPHWAGGEPNNAGGNEDAGHFYAGDGSGRWNDRPATDSMAGYVVEFETPPVRIYTAIELEFVTRVGLRYQLQSSTDMLTWTDAGSPIEGTGTSYNLLVSTRHTPHQFFRAEPIDLTCGLVAFYPFDGSADDASGNANNGTVFGATPTTNRFGGSNSAYLFDGTETKYILAPDSPSLNITNAISLSAWMWANSWQGNARILEKGDFLDDQYFLIVRDDGPLEFHLAGTTNPQLRTGPPSVGAWHHVAATYDGAWMRIFVDGVLVSQGPSSNPINAGSGGALGIGIKPQGGTEHEAFDGVIDDVRIYNRALFPSEIKALFNAPN